ncbi:hypothetical protein F4779DRAFT_636217 [Xylariaceae sp. FL0662B]|nr:hypothetical protein F4779DRAFT_636217 [Xylariaceae sp. FL0662B]
MAPGDMGTRSLGQRHNNGRSYDSNGKQNIVNNDVSKPQARYPPANEFNSYVLHRKPAQYLSNVSSNETRSSYTGLTDSATPSSNGLDESFVDECNDSSHSPSHPMRYLPGCSGGKPKNSEEKQLVSNAMMQAYVKMRGPCMGGADDPLFEWIRLREDLPLKKPPTHTKHVSRMLEMIDKALESDNMGGDSPRDAIFEVKRPVIQHIEPPADMDLSIHALTACCADFEVEDDEDDEEGNVPSGRISPCTFLAWSKDCVRWDEDEIKDIAANTKRHRPPAPEFPATPKDHFPHYYTNAESQHDVFSGEELSPYYVVPSSPSIIYTPPGIPQLNFPSAQFQEKYSRMAPLVARDLRDKQYGRPDTSASPTGTNEHYTYSEVERVANSMSTLGIGTLQGPQLPAHIAGQWRSIAEAEAEEAALYAEVNLQKTRIAELEAERARLRQYYLPALRERRARDDAAQKAKSREARIREHLTLHARDAQHRFDLAWVKRAVQRRRADDARDRVARLELEIAEDCLLVGKLGPQDVYDEVLGLAPPPSPSETARAREIWLRGGLAGREKNRGAVREGADDDEEKIPGSFGSWSTDL